MARFMKVPNTEGGALFINTDLVVAIHPVSPGNSGQCVVVFSDQLKMIVGAGMAVVADAANDGKTSI